MNDKDNQIVIVLDWKKSRIRIYKETLYQIGKPDNICLLVNPETMTIAVQAAPCSVGVTHKLDWKKLQGARSIELYSRAFLSRLFNMKLDWNAEHSYRIYGKVNHRMNVAEFKIADAISLDDLNS